MTTVKPPRPMNVVRTAGLRARGEGPGVILCRLVLLACALPLLTGGCRRSTPPAPVDTPAAPTKAPDSVAASVAGTPTRPEESVDADRPNFVLITIDTLRADHLGCYGYFRDTSPALDALARESLRFEHCVVPLARTTPTHASLLTGLYPLEHGVVDNVTHSRRQQVLPDDIRTYAQIAEEAGYATAGFVSAAPLKRESGLSRGFQTWTEPADAQRPADETTADALAWLNRPPETPFFLWIHYFDPHSPYRPPDPYDAMFTTDDALKRYMEERRFAEETQKQHIGGEVRAAKSWDSAESINRYDGEIRFVDTQFARVLEALRTEPLWNNTVIVVTADHGEGLGQHNWPNHGGYWHEQLHVPLLIRVPRHAPGVVERPVSTVDILTTVLHLAPELPRRAHLEQSTGVDTLAAAEARPVVSQTPGDGDSTVWTLTTAEWRLVAPGDGPLQLFRLATDPHELTDVASEFPETVKELHEHLTSCLSAQRAVRARSRGSSEGAPMSQERLRQLSALGYIDDDSE